MRPQQQNRRMRGRNNNPNNNSNNNGNNNSNRKGPNPLTRSYESNGPDVKIRGSAHQIAEKYSTLARDAHSSGDRVMAENYLQHAEHYNRIIMAAQAQMPQQRDYRDEEGEEGEDERDEFDSPLAHQSQQNQQPYQNGGNQQPRQQNDARREGASQDGSGPQPVIDGVPAEVALGQGGYNGANGGANGGGNRFRDRNREFQPRGEGGRGEFRNRDNRDGSYRDNQQRDGNREMQRDGQPPRDGAGDGRSVADAPSEDQMPDFLMREAGSEAPVATTGSEEAGEAPRRGRRPRRPRREETGLAGSENAAGTGDGPGSEAEGGTKAGADGPSVPSSGEPAGDD